MFFLISISGFTLASALCGLSNSLGEIVAARLAQGVFGAALVPLAQVVLMDINPREKQGPAMAVWGMGVMVGPILGPTLGGWLTDSYNWRWVFFINIPVGIFAFYGTWRYIRPDTARRIMHFDAFGFATLSLALAALQLLLDRGQQNDWFSSNESWIELVVGIMAATYFVAHTIMTPAERTFLDYRLFKNRNYTTGLMFIFIIGLVLYATRALTPTMMENLLGYPVATTGLVSAPAGIGSMIAMLIAGRIVGKVDLRLILLIGLLVSAFALWQMTGYTLDMSQSDIVWPGVLQGFGTGLIFVPVSAATFATLSSDVRAQGTSIYSLMRNVGSSIGISLVQTLLTRNTVIAHATLTERITYANPAWHNPAVAAAYDLHTPVGAAFLDSAVTQQATMIAYIDDFWFMLMLTLLMLPILLLIKPPKRDAVMDETHAVMD